MKNMPSLRSVFRAAAFSGLAALGLLTGCGTSAPDTKLEVVENGVFLNIDQGKWSDWIERQYAYLENDSNRVHYDAWLAQLDGVKDASLLDKANAVNDLVNKTITYVEDTTTYNTGEYWASGVEATLKGVGDCEDFAAAKFYAMQYLGVPESRYALLLVATDSTGADGSNHVVLAVDTSAANDWGNCLILDNDEYFLGFRTGGLETLSQTKYKPFVMIDELTASLCRQVPLKTPKP